MSRVCQKSGKGPKTGHNVSHSNRKTKKRILPNIQNKRLFNPETGRWEKTKVAVSTLRTLVKNPKKYK